MKLPLVIIDTNVVVAGLLTANPDSPPARILDAMLSGRLLFLLSPALLAEYRNVLLRPRIRELHALTEEEVDSILTDITTSALWRTPADTPRRLPPDPDDGHLWSLLEAEPAARLVTGDKMLVAHSPGAGRVIPPDGFLPELPA